MEPDNPGPTTRYIHDQNSSTNLTKELSEEELKQLDAQNSRLVSDFQAKKCDIEAKKYWDLFYKRNETRFFKDRHWTTREFDELICDSKVAEGGDSKRMLEIGCGVGNLIFPLVEDCHNKYFIYACDLSPRAVDFVKSNRLYNEERMHAFQCDITCPLEIFKTIDNGSVDIITFVFVLSAINPDKFDTVIKNIGELLKPGGVVLFRDYGLYDMAQLRFKAGHKIAENFYMRQDGTRSYYFQDTEVKVLFERYGFETLVNSYIHRRTINPKENIDVPRIFVQGKFRKC